MKIMVILIYFYEKDIPHSFRKGDLVILYPESENGYDSLTQHILKGSIKELHHNRLIVSLFNKQTDYTFIREYNYWAIEPDIFERNYWSKISCLFNFLKCDPRRSDLLLGVEEPLTENNFDFEDVNLTPHQNICITRALNARDYFLLQGPPGTGKTSTFLVNYIGELVEQTTDKIIVLAFTNKAVEKICQSLKEPRSRRPIDYIRLGSKHVEDDYLFAELIEDDDNPDNWQMLLEQNRVLVTTVATFQNNLLLLKQFIDFKNVIIDEASQLTEADLAGILATFEKFVLVGDHKQLPAIVTQHEKTCKVHQDALIEYGINDLRTSMFERLMINASRRGWHHSYGQLTDHYRMHEHIASLITSHYNEPLVAVLPEQKTLISLIPYPPSHPYNLSQRVELFSSKHPLIQPPARIDKKQWWPLSSHKL
ncbi:MAG: AAA family ATPase [Saprospiraceae bacterium]|uniref:AAA family ATPase n=1 Tax=Candidatus Opimibacter skivensis TaxID=2982028 RepID=A0A9D7SXR1_9BACT|nr:AAA family ATPase [Candidatus Opimibacter skivensis]